MPCEIFPTIVRECAQSNALLNWITAVEARHNRCSQYE